MDGSEQPKRGRKFDDVLNGARQVFLSRGFEGAGVDEIARVSGVSKATLYSYFQDKEQLFVEVVRTECQRMADGAEASIDPTAPAELVLHFVAEQIVRFTLSDFSIKIFRICVAEAERFPKLGREFYEAGPLMGQRRLAEYFRAAAERGELHVEHFELAADQFTELCQALLYPQIIFGIRSEFSEDEIKHVAHEAVMTFLARYRSDTGV